MFTNEESVSGKPSGESGNNVYILKDLYKDWKMEFGFRYKRSVRDLCKANSEWKPNWTEK